MTVRPATERDLAAVHAIAQANASAPQWTLAQFADVLQPRSGSAVQRILLVSEAAGHVTGFASASALSTVYPVQAELESIVVLPEQQGQGIGRSLLDAVFAWCVAGEVAELRLEVRVSNANAISLYERAGFRSEGIRPAYYKRPTEDAMCMVSSSFSVETHPGDVLNPR